MKTGLATKAPRGTERGDEMESAVIRFAGDSGDGIQLTGTQFAQSTALVGNDLATFPDYPAEIRAPIGTTFGVSAFQINFGSYDITTAGDAPDILVAMNPAALKVNLSLVKDGGMVVVDTGTFVERNLRKAGYQSDPLKDNTLAGYQVIELDISRLTLDSVQELGLSKKDALRCKNMWTLGLILWMFGRKRQPVVEWLEQKFTRKPEIAVSNIAALNAGHAFGETAEMSGNLHRQSIGKAKVEPGTYRTVTGGEALSLGLVVGSHLAGLRIVFGSYPITPASPILHQLAGMKEQGVITFQAEDEIAAMCSAIGASFAGSLGVTSSSGPGIALKGEAIGLAIMVELPLVIVNTQRGGPSTGLPTKTEQSDLYQAVFGRNGDAPLPVIAAASPTDCFDAAIEAVRLATKYMTPVILLTDGYLGNAAEPWRIPNVEDYAPFPVTFHTEAEDFRSFRRDPGTLARNWAMPGTPGLEHRIGGLEKDFETGDISYDAKNHQRMTLVRRDKVLGIAKDLPPLKPAMGEKTGALAVVGWGSTYGAIQQAVRAARKEGLSVSHIHLRHIWPFQADLGDLLAGFERIIVPEMNTGQLITLLRDQYLVDAKGVNKIEGQPFKVSEILSAIYDALEN
ncbi:MAG: 2-oxoacid:acceptor oxidoreductase subunit alpha [Sphingomonadales bacterium]